MKLKYLSLSLAVALSSLGVALESKANSVSTFNKFDSASEISIADGVKVSDSLTVQLKAARMATLRAQSGGAHINLRSRPTVHSRAMGYGLPNDRVELLQCVLDSDTPGSDLNWCRVRFPQSGVIGWIRSDFIIFPSDGE
jgi:hypothetical protein